MMKTQIQKDREKGKIPERDFRKLSTKIYDQERFYNFKGHSRYREKLTGRRLRRKPGFTC
jgi:hypothetical protein